MWSIDENTQGQDQDRIHESKEIRDIESGRIRKQSNGSQLAKEHVEMSDMNAATDNSSSEKTHTTDHNTTADTGNSTEDEGLLPSPVEPAIPDVYDDTPRAFNLYRNKKLLSHGMMDVALFSANANQLRYVLDSSDGSAFYVICVMLLLISIVLQILVGVALLLSARYNVTNCDQRKMAFKLGNYVIVGIFLITVVNVFITSFGGPVVNPSIVMDTIVTNSTVG